MLNALMAAPDVDRDMFAVGGVTFGVRADGRGPLDYRACVVTEDTMMHANGSAAVTLGGLGIGSTTRCLGVVKAEVGLCSELAGGGEKVVMSGIDGLPSKVKAPRGIVDGAVTLAMFRGSLRERQEQESLLSESLSRVLSSSPAFLERLVIPGSCGEFCWVLHVDVIVLEAGGSILDAASFAAHAALRSCVLPRVRAVEAEAGKLQLELVSEGEIAEIRSDQDTNAEDPPYEFLDVLGDEVRRMMPISITLTIVNGRNQRTGDLDEYVLVDTSESEELCEAVSSRITVSVDVDGHVCALDVRSSGSNSAVSSTTLKRCIRAAARVGRCIFQTLHKDEI